MSADAPKQVQLQQDIDESEAAQKQIYKKWRDLHVNLEGIVVLSVLCLFAPQLSAWLSPTNPELAKYIQSPYVWGALLTVVTVNTLSYSYRLRNAIRRANPIATKNATK